MIQAKNERMSGLNIIHFLKISGMIAEERKHEFEKTIRFACGMLSEQCLVKQLSAEMFTNDTYYFFSEWATEFGLRRFIKSEEYHLIRSAYDVLGVLQKIEIGYGVEIKTIHINQ